MAQTTQNCHKGGSKSLIKEPAAAAAATTLSSPSPGNGAVPGLCVDDRGAGLQGAWQLALTCLHGT